MKNIKVLITGITGYIGSRLARSLLSDCDVCGLVREPLRTMYIEDIRSDLNLLTYDGSYGSVAEALERVQPDIVYHLAACCSGSHGPEQTPRLVDANITFGSYLLEAMAAMGQLPFVYAATIASHYENAIYCPQNLYGATKQAFSDMLTYYTNTGLLRAVSLVLSDTYGPNDNRPKILNLIRNAVRSGETIALSDGTQDYDVVYIDDVVRAFQLAGEHLLRKNNWRNETFQICAATPLTLRQTVEKMLEVNHLTLNAAWGQRPRQEYEIHTAIRLYPLLPGWRQLVSLDEGLKRFYEERVHSEVLGYGTM